MADELQHGRNCDALAHPVDGDCTCGLTYRREIAACIDLIPENLRVQVCEGGGPENLAASLAVSIAKLAAHAKEQGKNACEMFDEVKRCQGELFIVGEQLDRSDAALELATRGLESMSKKLEVKDAIINHLLGGRCIDHIDGNPNNWDLPNLRVVTRSENLPKKRKR